MCGRLRRRSPSGSPGTCDVRGGSRPRVPRNRILAAAGGGEPAWTLGPVRQVETVKPDTVAEQHRWLRVCPRPRLSPHQVSLGAALWEHCACAHSLLRNSGLRTKQATGPCPQSWVLSGVSLRGRPLLHLEPPWWPQCRPGFGLPTHDPPAPQQESEATPRSPGPGLPDPGLSPALATSPFAALGPLRLTPLQTAPSLRLLASGPQALCPQLPSPVSPGHHKDTVRGAQPSPSCLVSPRAARLEVPTTQRQPAPCSRGPPGTHASLGPRLCLHDAALVRGSRRKVRPAVLPRPLGREHCGVTETGHGRPLPGWARGSPTAGGRARQGPRPGGSHRSARHPCGRDSGWTVFLGCCVHRVPCPPFLEETRGSPP